MEDLKTERRVAFRLAPLALALVIAACSHTTPSIGGSPAISPAPGKPYVPPNGVVPPEPDSTNTKKTLPSDVAGRANSLTLADAVDIALRNNPQTSLSWSQARTAAYEYASTKGAYFPVVDATASVGRSQSTTQTGFVERTQFAPLVSLSYLLLDFGGQCFPQRFGHRQRVLTTRGNRDPHAFGSVLGFLMISTRVSLVW